MKSGPSAVWTTCHPKASGNDVVALDVELCRRWRSRWRSCGSMTADVNTWPRWSTGGPLPRLHVVRRALTNRTTTAGSGRCAESEAAAIVTKVTVGQYVKLQVWTMRCLSSMPGRPTEVGSMQCSARWHHQAPASHSGCLRTGAVSPAAQCRQARPNSGTHDRGQTGILDQWWNWLRQVRSCC